MKSVKIIHTPDDLSNVTYNQLIQYICKNCGRIVQYLFQGKARINRYNELLCDKCRHDRTCINKYGVDNPSKSEEIQEKIKQTNIKKYGCECALQNEEIKQKGKATRVRLYGYEYTFQDPNKVKEFEQICIEKYGTPHPYVFGSKEYYDNMEKKYGDKYYCNREKTIQTDINRYGVDYLFKSKKT